MLLGRPTATKSYWRRVRSGRPPYASMRERAFIVGAKPTSKYAVLSVQFCAFCAYRTVIPSTPNSALLRRNGTGALEQTGGSTPRPVAPPSPMGSMTNRRYSSADEKRGSRRDVESECRGRDAERSGVGISTLSTCNAVSISDPQVATAWPSFTLFEARGINSNIMVYSECMHVDGRPALRQLLG
jgi:hypothetical protein